MDIDTLFSYTSNLAIKPRTLETVENLQKRRGVLDDLVQFDDEEEAIEAEDCHNPPPIKTPQFLETPIITIAPAESTTVSILPKPIRRRSSLNNHNKRGSISAEMELLPTPKAQPIILPALEVVTPKTPKMFDSLKQLITKYYHNPSKCSPSVVNDVDSQFRTSFLKDVIKVGKGKPLVAPPPKGAITWQRLSSYEKKKVTIPENNSRHYNKQPKLEVARKRPDEPMESIILSRLLVSLSHPHPSEINKYFVDFDRKSRINRRSLTVAEFTEILSKPPSNRSPIELQGVDDFLRLLPEFQTKPEYILKSLGTSLTANQFQLGDNIFRQGDPGNKWYVILQGTVKITVSKPGYSILDANAPQNFIATMNSGEKFGDHAILNDLARSASAWADSPATILLGLEKLDFLRLIGQAYQIDQKNRVSFLKKIPMLSRLDLQSLRNIADRLVIRTHPPNSILQREDEVTDSVSFIQTGECAIFRQLEVEERGKKIKRNLLLGHLGVNSSFNEDCVFSHRTTRRKGAPFTIVAIDSVVTASIASSGEWISFNLARSKSIYEEMPVEELTRRYNLSLHTKNFRRYQKKYFSLLGFTQ